MPCGENLHNILISTQVCNICIMSAYLSKYVKSKKEWNELTENVRNWHLSFYEGSSSAFPQIASILHVTILHKYTYFDFNIAFSNHFSQVFLIFFICLEKISLHSMYSYQPNVVFILWLKDYWFSSS